MILLQIFGCGIMVLPLSAADPITGTWKLDVGSSKFVGSPPKEQIETYSELATGDIEMVLSRIEKEGAPTTTSLTWPARGGVVHDPASALPKGETVIETLLGPGDWLAIFLTDDKQVATMYKVISRDGKVMVQTIEALDSHGLPIEQVQILHRQ
jgi:hypothetical protein